MMFPKKKWNKKSKKTLKEKYLQKTIPELINKLDKIFSEYIRKRDADCNGNCRCITCGSYHNWKEVDAGHFITRDRKVTRYDERNVNAQCHKCNRLPKYGGKSGEQWLHGKMIDCRYGKGTAELLKTISDTRGGKLTTEWLIYHMDLFKKKIKVLNNIKNF